MLALIVFLLSLFIGVYYWWKLDKNLDDSFYLIGLLISSNFIQVVYRHWGVFA